jgi:hypothetical protein
MRGGRALLALPSGPLGRSVAGSARLIAAAMLVSIGIIHLVLAPTYYQAAAYVGVLFFATCGVAWLTAAAILVGVRGAWLMGSATALGAGIALMLSATTGLPGFTDSLSAPYATLSLALEAALVLLFGLLVLVRRSVLLTPRGGGHASSR